MFFARLRNIWQKFTLAEKRTALILTGLFLIGLIFLISNGISKITVAVPKQGGSWRIGTVGSPHFINPILIQDNDIDRDLSELIYNGLFKMSSDGKLSYDLAEKSEISPDGKIYTIYLKDDVLWHDGETFTADDVIFTIEAIQDAEYQSPLKYNWQGVIAEKVSDSIVRFSLKNPYEPFLQNLTLKIMPKHIWQNVSPRSFVLADYNLKPIGTGPYLFEKFQKDASGQILSYTFQANSHYYAGPPYIQDITFNFYDDFDKGVEALLKKNIDSLTDLPVDKYPALAKKLGWKVEQISLPRYYAVFFNANKNRVLSDKNVRQALSSAIDKNLIISQVLFGQANPLNTPISSGFIGYSEELNKNNYDLNASLALLEKSGWVDSDQDGTREKTYSKEKTETELTLKLVLPKNKQLEQVAELIKSSWQKLGVKVEWGSLALRDLEKDYLKERNYESVLFGNMLGVDPDLFAFWHSSQRNDPGLNLSLYGNVSLDALLEETRQTSNQDTRLTNLTKIQDILLSDSPAVFLYNPYYLYANSSTLKGNSIKIANYPSERLSDISQWYLYTKRVFK